MSAVNVSSSGSSRLVPRRCLSVVLVQYDRRRYPGALPALRTHLELLANESWSLVAVDNADPGPWERELAPGVSQIGGDNEAWEFSGFDRGIDWLAQRRGLGDFVLLVTDAFRAYGQEYLGWFDQALIDTARRSDAAVGWVDSFGRSCTLDGTDYESWLRTSFLLLPASCLEAALPLAMPFAREDLFSGDPAAPWRTDSMVGLELREAIEGWLVEGRAGQSGLAENWHSSFALNSETLDFFERKSLAILREHHLSLRLRAAGALCFDLRLAGLRALQSPTARPAAGEQWLRGVHAFAEAGAEDQGSTDGPRLLVGSGSWLPEDVAFVRWIVLEVVPLVRQREARVVVEIVGPHPPTPVSTLATLGLARLSEPGSADPLPAAMLVMPSGGDFSAAHLPGAQDSILPVVEADWREPMRRGRAASTLAEQIVGELRSPRVAVVQPPSGAGSVADEDEAPPGPSPLEPVTLRSSADFRRWQRVEADEVTRRAAYERSLVKSSEPFLVEAWCYVCRRQTGQHVDFEYFGSAESMMPNWRERLVCQRCGLNAKARAVLHVLAEVVVPKRGARILVCEDRSGLSVALPRTLPEALVVDAFSELEEATDFEAVDRRLGEPVDSLLVMDVFSTVADLGAAARVCERIVAPGGALVFTAPFRTDRERTVESFNEEGVDRELGWDVLGVFREVGFEDVAAQFLWSSSFGYLGGTVVVFTARKNPV